MLMLGNIRPLCYKPWSAPITLDPVAVNGNTHTHTVSFVLSHAHPLTCTCLHISSQHLALHLALLSVSGQFKWIIRLVMQRKWIVHLLISDQSPLSCSWCRIRLALCEMTLASVQHCDISGFQRKIWHLFPGERAFSPQTANIFHIPDKWDTNAMSPLSVPLVQMLICIIINKERQCAQAHSLILISPCFPSPTVFFFFYPLIPLC